MSMVAALLAFNKRVLMNRAAKALGVFAVRHGNRCYRLEVGLILFVTCYIRVFFKFQNLYVEISSHWDAMVISQLREHSCESFRLTIKTRDEREPMKCLKRVSGADILY